MAISSYLKQSKQSRTGARIGIELNYLKSATMIIRPDRRTKLHHKTIKNIPVVESYKYLGIVIDDTAWFTPLKEELDSRLRSYKRQLGMCWSTKIPHTMRYLTWSTFIHSKFSYALSLVVHYNPKIESFSQKLLYQSFKGLLQTRCNPSSNQLIESILGICPAKFYQITQQATL